MTNSTDGAVTYKRILDRAADDASEAMPDFPKLPERQCYADSARGIYIPQYFAESVNRDMCDVPDTWLDELIKGPETEFYWDIWQDILNITTLTDSDGSQWHLEQDGDLWLVPTGLYEAWEDFQEQVEAVEAYEVAHESSEWDWVIYYHWAMELCHAVPSSVLHEAESQWADMYGVDSIDDQFGLFELAAQLANLIVVSEITQAVEQAKEELIDLVQTNIDNM